MNRSCQFCRWRIENKTFIGIVHICKTDGKETKLGGYCPYFRSREKIKE